MGWAECIGVWAGTRGVGRGRTHGAWAGSTHLIHMPRSRLTKKETSQMETAAPEKLKWRTMRTRPGHSHGGGGASVGLGGST